MDGEVNLPALPAPAPEPEPGPEPAAPPPTRSNLVRPIYPDTNFSRSFTSTLSSSSSSSSSSPPDFIRHVQAAFKRHRPLGIMQSNSIKPRRLLVPQREVSRSSTSSLLVDAKKTQDEIPLARKARDSIALAKNKISAVKEAQVDASTTPPSVSDSIVDAYDGSLRPFNSRGDQHTSIKNSDPFSSLLVSSEHVPLAEGQKKVQFSEENNSKTHGAGDLMATITDNLLSHMCSLGLTEMELDANNQVEVSTAKFQNVKVGISMNSEGGSSLLVKRPTGVQNQLTQFRNFLQNDLSHPITQSSDVGSSCATTTLVNSASAPMICSTTHCSHPHQSRYSSVDVESLGDQDLDRQPAIQQDAMQSLGPSSNYVSRISGHHTAIEPHGLGLAADSQLDVKDHALSKDQQNCVLKEPDIPKAPSSHGNRSTKMKELVRDVIDVQLQGPMSKDSSLDMKLEPSKAGKQENSTSSKVTSAPRKKSYDPDLFFKVNGKLYQRLGKIGSGGSSEVHKVISSDCTIYALKKIKLKGRDYGTAYGFCQEMEYLNKLKGKSHIIQLIDYEVTDKALLQAVMNGSMSNKDGRVKDDGFIYMVLEYGEIDLAHMLSQKWKELDSSNSTIDENWLRFYWQQILLAVNTIHEERIVHSDLKPANFLLVRGSLKLIDFGIAKAIMSDTTNIQRDSQVGTLSYMSPEAFMCNETDSNGNTIKCGRSSDIWSLGCILYQMVYGRTPFSEYKTFWAKFKIITDPNHEIVYEPLSNPWLLDLMKKCLAWDRNERWRIPQLLQHPFLVPPVSLQVSNPQNQSLQLLQLIVESCTNDPKALMLCHQLQQILTQDQR